jgi:hypothetical protein
MKHFLRKLKPKVRREEEREIEGERARDPTTRWDLQKDGRVHVPPSPSTT